jgi:hypothetical protein
MMRIMRTTIALDDHILAEAKERAAQRGMSLGQFVEDALRRVFARQVPDERPEIPILRGGKGVRPGIDLTSNRALYEVLDEGLPLEKLR